MYDDKASQYATFVKVNVEYRIQYGSDVNTFMKTDHKQIYICKEHNL